MLARAGAVPLDSDNPLEWCVFSTFASSYASAMLYVDGGCSAVLGLPVASLPTVAADHLGVFSLMFGALISAVDPVATLSILGASHVNAGKWRFTI